MLRIADSIILQNDLFDTIKTTNYFTKYFDKEKGQIYPADKPIFLSLALTLLANYKEIGNNATDSEKFNPLEKMQKLKSELQIELSNYKIELLASKLPRRAVSHEDKGLVELIEQSQTHTGSTSSPTTKRLVRSNSADPNADTKIKVEKKTPLSIFSRSKSTSSNSSPSSQASSPSSSPPSSPPPSSPTTPKLNQPESFYGMRFVLPLMISKENYSNAISILQNQMVMNASTIDLIIDMRFRSILLDKKLLLMQIIGTLHAFLRESVKHDESNADKLIAYFNTVISQITDVENTKMGYIEAEVVKKHVQEILDKLSLLLISDKFKLKYSELIYACQNERMLTSLHEKMDKKLLDIRKELKLSEIQPRNRRQLDNSAGANSDSAFFDIALINNLYTNVYLKQLQQVANEWIDTFYQIKKQIEIIQADNKRTYLLAQGYYSLLEIKNMIKSTMLKVADKKLDDVNLKEYLIKAFSGNIQATANDSQTHDLLSGWLDQMKHSDINDIYIPISKGRLLENKLKSTPDEVKIKPHEKLKQVLASWLSDVVRIYPKSFTIKHKIDMFVEILMEKYKLNNDERANTFDLLCFFYKEYQLKIDDTNMQKICLNPVEFINEFFKKFDLPKVQTRSLSLHGPDNNDLLIELKNAPNPREVVEKKLAELNLDTEEGFHIAIKSNFASLMQNDSLKNQLKRSFEKYNKLFNILIIQLQSWRANSSQSTASPQILEGRVDLTPSSSPLIHGGLRH